MFFRVRNRARDVDRAFSFNGKPQASMFEFANACGLPLNNLVRSLERVVGRSTVQLDVVLASASITRDIDRVRSVDFSRQGHLAAMPTEVGTTDGIYSRPEPQAPRDQGL